VPLAVALPGLVPYVRTPCGRAAVGQVVVGESRRPRLAAGSLVVVTLQTHPAAREEAVLLLGIVHSPTTDAAGPNAGVKTRVVRRITMVDRSRGRATENAGRIDRCRLRLTG
jgi:hypothetical protein